MLPVHRKYSKHYSSRQSFLASKMWGSDDEASIDKPAGMPAGPDTNATSNIEPPAREGRAVVPDLPRSSSPSQSQATVLDESSLSESIPSPATTIPPEFSSPPTARKRKRAVTESEETPPRSCSRESVGSSMDGLDADNSWCVYRTNQTKTGWLHDWGILNMMNHPTDNRVVCEGRRVRWAIDALVSLLSGKRRQYEHKIGIAYDARIRFEHYRDEEWMPHFMVLLARPSNREAAGYFEAFLIAHVISHEDFSLNSINLRHGDIGGEGRRREETANLPHYVYVCIKVVDNGGRPYFTYARERE